MLSLPALPPPQGYRCTGAPRPPGPEANPGGRARARAARKALSHGPAAAGPALPIVPPRAGRAPPRSQRDALGAGLGAGPAARPAPTYQVPAAAGSSASGVGEGCGPLPGWKGSGDCGAQSRRRFPPPLFPQLPRPSWQRRRRESSRTLNRGRAESSGRRESRIGEEEEEEEGEEAEPTPSPRPRLRLLPLPLVLLLPLDSASRCRGMRTPARKSGSRRAVGRRAVGRLRWICASDACVGRVVPLLAESCPRRVAVTSQVEGRREREEVEPLRAARGLPPSVCGLPWGPPGGRSRVLSWQGGVEI